MSRYIDVDCIDWRLIIPTNPTIAEENVFYRARKLVESQPTADVVEVVCCEDCKHRDEPSCQIKNSLYGLKGWDYCSYGERMDGEHGKKN